MPRATRCITTLLGLALVLALAPAVSAAGPGEPAAPKFHTRKVAIVLYPGVEVLDFAGPAEVFASAAGFGRAGSEPAFQVYTVWHTNRSPIVSQRFLDITPDFGIADAPEPDIIVIPGGMSKAVLDDADMMNWLRARSAKAEHVLTVCTGAFVAGKLGLLDGGEATTWYGAVPGLTRDFPNTRVTPGRRYVDNGKTITTAGVSAGIDGSLHLVARLLGRYVADQTAQYMEYKWTPEAYLAANYTQLNPGLDARGQELQRATILVREGSHGAAVDCYRRLTAADPADAEAWLGLGRTLHTLRRYDEAIAAHREAMKGAPQRPKALFNLACEYALTGMRDEAIALAAQAVESGYRERWSYENDADLATVRDDPRFRKLVAALPAPSGSD